MLWYLDTSALLKLLTMEDGSEAMRQWFMSHNSVWSSQLLQTEALQVSARLDIDTRVIEDALDTISLIVPSVATFHNAGRLSPSSLRLLDALHLAAAMEIGADLEGVISYDERPSVAVRAASLTVLTHDDGWQPTRVISQRPSTACTRTPSSLTA